MEDYDEAKRIKHEIEELQKPPPPPPPNKEEEEAAKHKLMIDTVKKGIVDVRDRNHGGDTHKFFDHLDHTGASPHRAAFATSVDSTISLSPRVPCTVLTAFASAQTTSTSTTSS